MLFAGSHKEIGPSLESIGAAFAIFEMQVGDGTALLVSANTLFEDVCRRPVVDCIGRSLA